MGSHTVVYGKPIALLSSVVFVQFAQRWSCLCWLGELSAAAGLDQARLLLPLNEIVRSPESVWWKQAVTQAATRGSASSLRGRQTPARSGTRWGEVLAGLLPAALREASRVEDISVGEVGIVWQQSDPGFYWGPAQVSWSGSCFQTTKGRRCDNMQVAHLTVKPLQAH